MSPLCKLDAVSPLDLGLRRSSLPAKTRTEVGHSGRQEAGLRLSTRAARARHQAGASRALRWTAASSAVSSRSSRTLRFHRRRIDRSWTS